MIVDRVKVDADVRTRLTDSIETAYTEGGGAAFAIQLGRGRSGSRSCTGSPSGSSAARCNLQYEVPQPRLFSFNNPFGACPLCHGFGNIIELDMALVVPDPTKSIQQNAIEPWSKPHYRAQLAELKRDRQEARAARRAVGRAHRRREAVRDRGRRRGVGRRQGFLPLARAQEVQGPRPRVPQPLPRLSDVSRVQRRAAASRGARRPGRRAHDRRRLRVDGARRGRASSRTSQLSEKDTAIADKVLREIRKRLGIPARRRAGLPHARSLVVDAVGRGIAADQPRDVAGLGAGRHALRARRAVDRPALTRQRAADRDPASASRSGEHRAGRRARRRHDPRRRHRRRHGARRGRAGRPRRVLGHARATC